VYGVVLHVILNPQLAVDSARDDPNYILGHGRRCLSD
jgi:hypothetical protein